MPCVYETWWAWLSPLTSVNKQNKISGYTHSKQIIYGFIKIWLEKETKAEEHMSSLTSHLILNVPPQ